MPPNPILIPDHAEKVFEGILYDVYQWPQEMFDGSTETFEMLKRPDSVVVMAIHEGRIVVIDEEQPGGIVRRSSLPKGRVDARDETVLAAAQREMLEETGMEFNDWRLLQITQPEHKIEWFVYYFVAQNKIAQHEVAHDAGEKITVNLVEFTDLKKSNSRLDKDLRALNETHSLEEFMAGLPAKERK